MFFGFYSVTGGLEGAGRVAGGFRDRRFHRGYWFCPAYLYKACN
ncbi:MAG TPA: hypothetical protein VKV77_08025 [Methylovirgula sp.]|nr:hypothetical protein [Methylovirgula sp.]